MPPSAPSAGPKQSGRLQPSGAPSFYGLCHEKAETDPRPIFHNQDVHNNSVGERHTQDPAKCTAEKPCHSKLFAASIFRFPPAHQAQPTKIYFKSRFLHSGVMIIWV